MTTNEPKPSKPTDTATTVASSGTRAKTCSFRKTVMTPCVIVDGDVCYAFGPRNAPVCVGCRRGPEKTGVPQPKDWAEQIEKYRSGE